MSDEERTSAAFMLRVTVQQGTAAGQSWDVRDFPAIVGRSAEADVCLAEDKSVSRRHLKVGLMGGYITLEDLSTNGTWVGGALIGPGQTVTLGEEAVVQLGPATMMRMQVVPDRPTVIAPPQASPQASSGAGGWLKSLVGGARTATAPPTQHVLELRALGVFRVTANGIAVADDQWQHRKAVVLLVYLADVAQPTAADRIWEVLWPDAADGRQAVQTAVSRMRKAIRDGAPEARLPDVVKFERKLYVLDSAISLWYDVAEFEVWVREAQRLWPQRDLDAVGRALECAIDLYRGPFLEGFDEPWVTRRRTYLERRWFEAMELLGALREEEKRLAEAVQIYHRILDADAGREQAHVGLVRSLAAQGRRDEALRQCLESITTLRKLLNLPASPELDALYRDLTSDGTVVPPPAS